MGYRTTQTISKLQHRKYFDRFELEVAKLNANISFNNEFPNLKNFTLAQGDILLVKDIAVAANSNALKSYDVKSVETCVLNRCQKVNKIRFIFFNYDFVQMNANFLFFNK